MSAPNEAASRAVVVATRSLARRRQLAHALSERGYDPVETADEVDTLHALTHVAPCAFVIATDAAGGRGVQLANGLLGLDRPAPRPTFLLAPGAELGAARAALDGRALLLDANAPTADLMRAFESGVAGVRPPAPGANSMPPSSAAAAMQAQVDAVERAMTLIAKVLQMVEQNRLPGPVVPTVLAEAMTLFADPNVTFDAIAAFAKRHQTISARLLAVANGALYARGNNRVATLEAAIARLGLTTTRDLVQAIAARAYVVGKDARLKQIITDKLKIAYLVSLIAGELARITRATNGARIQMVALFHNIGQVFLLYTLALMSERSTEPRLDPAIAEIAAARKTLEVNRLLTTLANVPREVVAVFSARDAGDGETERLVTCIHQAMWFADRLVAGVKPGALAPDDEMLQVGLKQDVVVAMSPRLPAILEAIDNYGA
jgi:hypothetical protein